LDASPYLVSCIDQVIDSTADCDLLSFLMEVSFIMEVFFRPKSMVM
jgi:hypothetical protein